PEIHALSLHDALPILINNRFNSLAVEDNDKGDRYHVELEIMTVTMSLDNNTSFDSLPMMEVLKTNIFDHKTGLQIEGVGGNNFRSEEHTSELQSRENL